MERKIIPRQIRCFVAYRAKYTILFSYYFTFKNNKWEKIFKTGLLIQNGNVFFENFQNQSFQALFSSKLITTFQPNKYTLRSLEFYCLFVHSYNNYLTFFSALPSIDKSTFFKKKDLYSGPIDIHFYTDAFKKMLFKNNKILW